MANLAASTIPLPSANATQNPPLNASPAPVVSTALTVYAGIIQAASLVLSNAPAFAQSDNYIPNTFGNKQICHFLNVLNGVSLNPE